MGFITGDLGRAGAVVQPFDSIVVSASRCSDLSTSQSETGPSTAGAVPLPETFQGRVTYLRQIFADVQGAVAALAELNRESDDDSADRDLATEARNALATLPEVRRIIGGSRAFFAQVLGDVVNYALNPDRRVPLIDSYNPHVSKFDTGNGRLELALKRRILGIGGFGVVTEDYCCGDRRATKTLALWNEGPMGMGNVGSAIFLSRFAAEPTMLRRLYDRGCPVPRVIDSGFDRGYPFFSMEYIDGMDLGKLNCSLTEAEHSGQRRPLKELYLFLAGVAQSFAEMHNPEGATTVAGTAVDFVEMSGNNDRPVAILHRDIKPSNIMLGRDGGATILDFGIAKEHDDGTPDQTALTQTGQIMGTPSHTAPEITRFGSRHASRESDAYSFGCCLYHMITGKSPFCGNLFDIHRGHEGEFPDFDLIPDLHVRGTVMRLMNKHQENRGPKGVRDAPLSDIPGVLHRAYMKLATEDERLRYENFLSQSPRERKVPELVSLCPPDAFALGTDSGDLNETADLPVTSKPQRRARRPVKYVVGKNGQPVRMNLRRRVLRRLSESRVVKIVAMATGVSLAAATAMLSYVLYTANKSSPAHADKNGNSVGAVTPDSPETIRTPKTAIEYSFNNQGGVHDILSITVVVDGKEVTIPQEYIYRVFDGEASNDVRASLFEHPGSGSDGSSPYLCDVFMGDGGHAVVWTTEGYQCVSPGKGIVCRQNDGDEFKSFVQQHIRKTRPVVNNIDGKDVTVPRGIVCLENASSPVPPSVQKYIPAKSDALSKIRERWDDAQAATNP